MLTSETKTQPLYMRLASAFTARANCERTGNREWFDRWTDTIDRLIDDYMPSGSGWDHGTHYDLSQWKPDRIKFTGSFHHMNDGGMYDGWTDHAIIVTPTFDGIALDITGRDRGDIKDVLHDNFYHALTLPISDAVFHGGDQ